MAEHRRAAREHGGAGEEHERAQREHERAVREQGGVQREHMAEIGLSAEAMRRYRILETRGYYIPIYPFNLFDIMLLLEGREVDIGFMSRCSIETRWVKRLKTSPSM